MAPFYCVGDCTYHYRSEIPQNLQPYFERAFESDIRITNDFRSFARKYKNAVVKLLPEGFCLIEYHVGHFEVSGIIKTREGETVYFSIPDVRYWPEEWCTNILVRRNGKGLVERNHYTTLFTFAADIANI